jgi:hypothetical protein
MEEGENGSQTSDVDALLDKEGSAENDVEAKPKKEETVDEKEELWCSTSL